VLADLPVNDVDTDLPAEEQVEAKVRFANDVLEASEDLLSQCGRLSACTVVTTTVPPTTTTSRPQTNRPSSPASSAPLPECESVILLRALARDSRGTYDEYEYLGQLANSLPPSWSLTAASIRDALRNGFLPTAHSYADNFVAQKC